MRITNLALCLMALPSSRWGGRGVPSVSGGCVRAAEWIHHAGATKRAAHYESEARPAIVLLEGVKCAVTDSGAGRADGWRLEPRC